MHTYFAPHLLVLVENLSINVLNIRHIGELTLHMLHKLVSEIVPEDSLFVLVG